MIRAHLLGLTVAAFVAGAAGAGPLEDAQAAYERKDFATAQRLWSPLAEQGVADAEFGLGRLFLFGNGVIQDGAQAVSWLSRAAANGRTNVGWLLGQIYDGDLDVLGLNVVPDSAEAVRWYRVAAEGGFMAAWQQLAEHYAEGRGVAQDFAEAIKWYRKLADEGDIFAQSQIGEFYRVGRGVPQDYAEAARWFGEAGNGGYAYAQYQMGLLYRDGRGVRGDVVEAYKWLALASGAAAPFPGAEAERTLLAVKMTAAQIAEAQRLANAWKPK